MDIAEIRKKARGKAGGADSVQPPPSAPEPVVETVGESLPDFPGTDLVDTRATFLDLPDEAFPTSGLDRLFAGTGTGQFATEEIYQTALASQDARKDAGFEQFLAFQLGAEEYALDITRISEIIKPREYTDIPRVPEYILGLISLRGVVVPVFDLRRRFRLGETRQTSAARVIVCREGDVVVGLLVDSINQVIRLAADAIEPPPAVLTGVDRSLVEGVGRFQGRMIIVLNLASVLDTAMV